MEIRNLSESREEIISCFLEAFSGYYVQMPQDYDYYKQRWVRESVDFTLSFGAFEDGQLVAFILNAIDAWNGKKTAYNAATGVIPAFRGRRLVKHIYQKAINMLKMFGVEQLMLEVIQENEKAIKAYESVGFEIIKNYRCYKGNLDIETNHTIQVKQVNFKEEIWAKLPQSSLSWSNHRRSLSDENTDIYIVLNEQEKEIAYFIIAKNRESLHQLGVFDEKPLNWQKLLQALHTVTTQIKITNVDEKEVEKNKVLLNANLKNTFNQFEMIKVL